jgi:hypothetical protein
MKYMLTPEIEFLGLREIGEASIGKMNLPLRKFAYEIKTPIGDNSLSREQFLERFGTEGLNVAFKWECDQLKD